MRRGMIDRKPLLALLLLGPVLAGCTGASDLLSKDADWFSRSGRVFVKSVSIETPPLTPDKPVAPDDLISADGLCTGMAPPIGTGGSGAPSDNATAAPPTATGTVALGHTECDVTRGIGVAPDNVSLSNNPGGDRVAVLTFLRGPRAGTYTFSAGRLSSIERAPELAAPQKPERRAKKKKGAAT